MMTLEFKYLNPNKYRTVHDWLFSSLVPEEENNYELGGNKANLARLAYISFGPPL